MRSGRAVARIAEFQVTERSAHDLQRRADRRRHVGERDPVGGLDGGRLAVVGFRPRCPRSTRSSVRRWIKAVVEENARWGSPGVITVVKELVGDRPAGSISEDAPIVRPLWPRPARSVFPAGSARGRPTPTSPMSLNIPAITIGGGGRSMNAHAPDEVIRRDRLVERHAERRAAYDCAGALACVALQLQKVIEVGGALMRPRAARQSRRATMKRTWARPITVHSIGTAPASIAGMKLNIVAIQKNRREERIDRGARERPAERHRRVFPVQLSRSLRSRRTPGCSGRRVRRRCGARTPPSKTAARASSGRSVASGSAAMETVAMTSAAPDAESDDENPHAGGAALANGVAQGTVFLELARCHGQALWRRAQIADNEKRGKVRSSVARRAIVAQATWAGRKP